MFIEKHGKVSFEKFKEKSLLIRSSDRSEIIVFIYDNSISDQCGFVRLIISQKNKELISSSFVPQKDNCTLSYDQEEYYKLTTDFLQLGINSLSVDKDNNVFVKTTFYEGLPDLIQVNNQDSIKNFDQLFLIKDNWYKRQ